MGKLLIGNIKGPQGATGAQGAQGAQGEAATIQVGSVTTSAYGTAASVTNSGTASDAIFDFNIPQGKPGEATTKMGDLSLDAITTSIASFPSPQVGDTGKTAFGKIVKFFADTVAALNAKLNTANVVNNLTTTEAGYALDARAGKTLNDSLAEETSHFRRLDGPTSGGLSAFTEFADTSVVGGRLQWFRMRSGTPSSAYNYSQGFIMRQTESDTTVIMFGRTTHNILLLSKIGGTWDTEWTIII